MRGRRNMVAPLASAVVRARQTILFVRPRHIAVKTRSVFLTLETIVRSRSRGAAVRPLSTPASPFWLSVSESEALDARSRLGDVPLDDMAVVARLPGEVSG